ncbi:MAG TPA: site-specific integrase [Nitrococcus sp.]|nr:site-specific integrase [Nitrococcus sp.]
MATIRRRDNRYHVQIRKKGSRPLTKSFLKRDDATAWARKVESEIERGIYVDSLEAQHTTLADALNRYGKEVIWNHSKRQLPKLSIVRRHLGHHNLARLSTATLASYRDSRLEVVSAQTVKHELGLIDRVLKKCVTEWGIHLPKGIPIVSKPKLPQGRTRRLEVGEEDRLIAALKDTLEIRSIVLLALETAMRREELTSIDWKHVDLKKQVLHIPKTKTGVPRTIPLSGRAVEVLKGQPRQLAGNVFSVQPDSVTQAFSRACKRAGIEGLRFHDLRHEATSRLFEKGLEMMEVASITGHRDLRMLRRYTHLKAEDLVAKLG